MHTLCVEFLLAAALAFAQEPLPPTEPIQQPHSAALVTRTTVHGFVHNAATGEPLPRALVRIEGDADAGTLTDGEGRFELPGVPVGPQTIQVRKPGFLDRPYASEDAGYQNTGPAHSVLVAAEMPELNFTLTPTSAIHGHIELSTGDPAQAITVTLLKQMIRNGRAVWAQNGTTKTNGSGAYRFAGLPAGVYALFTQPAMESEPVTATFATGAKVTLSGYPTLFYPEARNFADATRITLRSGEQAEANMLLTLEPFYAVTATPILPNGKPLTGNGALEETQLKAFLILDAAGRQLPYTAQFDSVTHSLQSSLPDGSYSLRVVYAMNESNFTSQEKFPERVVPKPALLSGFTEFSVEGHTVANLHIPLAPESGFPIHLRIVRTAPQSSANASQQLDSMVTVLATDAGEALSGNYRGDSTAVDAGLDLLQLGGTGPGPHWISTQVNDRSLCVDSFNAGGINLAREPLNVALGSSPPPMDLTLRDDCAKLALTLPLMLSTFLPGDEPFYTVYIVPDFDTTVDIPPMNMHPSSGATLIVDGLTPGNYHVYAFNHPVRLEYRNPAVLAALPTPGQAVTLSAGATSNLVLEVPER
jgi:hypothetical protein